MSHFKEYGETIKRNHRIPEVKDEYTDLKIPNSELIFKHLRSLKNGHRLFGKSLIQSYTVAEHCYYTGILFLMFAEREAIATTVKETIWVFQHDILESITGDVLLPVKSYSPETKMNWDKIENELTSGRYSYLNNFSDKNAKEFFSDEAWNLFKAIDLLELWIFCKEEQKLGNESKYLKVVIDNCVRIITSFNFEHINRFLIKMDVEDSWK